ncbi:AAA family ATPase [Escherichia coli O75:H38/H55]|jgi:predicted KAP-like P-loop ATPase|uniref:KAP family P-loop NTPase fold protein n=1 Tax=Escherichia coli TaxID=562 RepID=UPI000BE7D7C7|nr:P-loop NTPase fold protein [Escherichia coli]EFO2120688.1 NTPase [Escherichia coli O3]EGF2695579.1 NTPase [Shigella sonnei]EEW1498315.1 NTPase [Escherichia coli]EEW1956949.1 NTPase [Escherichia coli]EFC4245294.1 NTPase [Escherichia coli]
MANLSTDRPSSDPIEDLFGHGPFAENLASSICRYSGNDGLVLALYGPWGSGKSTVLSYVRHFLEQRTEEEQPTIVTFNPWWFSGQDNLARAFLGQMQAVLPAKSEKFKKLGDLLGDFAEGVGGLIDLSGMTGGAGSKFGKLIGMVTKRKPKDVPALKSEISKVLQDAGKRILIVIDDIDRLTPEETRQLFTVIKALADFPNVIYLLAFDREVASQAIEQQSGMPGERYLEKIIQVPFELPPIDRVALRAALFKRLDDVLRDTSDGLFDHSYWTNVFHSGLDPLFQVPRDIVRFTNTLSVTYPAVRNEVNPVDFIALEALRVFLPNLYDVIRTNQDKFSGHSSDNRYNGNPEATVAFHEQWVQGLPKQLRSSISDLLEHIFPKIGRIGYEADWLSQWRRNLRACHPDIFPTYFRMTVPPGAIRRSEMLALLNLAETPPALGEALIRATGVKRPDGLSKARALLERLMDHVEKDISDKHISIFIIVLLDIGDLLILDSDHQGSFDFGNESRITRVVYHLLKRVDPTQRHALLISAIDQGKALRVQHFFIAALSGNSEKESIIDSTTLDDLKKCWLQGLKTKLSQSEMLAHSQLDRLLGAWYRWGDDVEVKAWCNDATSSDDGLLTFLSKFCTHTRSQTMGDWAVHLQPRLNPTWLEQYIDTQACYERLIGLRQKGLVPDSARESLEQFLKEFEMLKAGKNPDGVGAFDD